MNITRRDAVRVAGSPAEMVEWVGRYLQDPSIDRAGRRQVVADQCQFTDGGSSERVVALVLNELGGAGTRAAA